MPEHIVDKADAALIRYEHQEIEQKRLDTSLEHGFEDLCLSSRRDRGRCEHFEEIRFAVKRRAHLGQLIEIQLFLLLVLRDLVKAQCVALAYHIRHVCSPYLCQ